MAKSGARSERCLWSRRAREPERAGLTEAPPRSRRRPDVVPVKGFDGLVLYAFVVLGLPDGTIGTAWPVLRKGFGAPLGDLGIFLLVGTLGSLLSSSVAGLLFARLGTRVMVMLGGTAGALGALGAVLSPSFWAFAASGSLIGVAAGLLDSTANTAVALTGRNRLLNMLHGSYGVGTTIAPLIATAAILAGSWRGSYAAVLGAELVLVAAWWFAGRLAQRASSQGPQVPAGGPGGASGDLATAGAKAPASRRRLAVLIGLGLAVFMVYTGLEVSAGQWAPSFDRAVLHMGAGATGLATFGYWGALTLARFALAVPRRPVPPAAVVRWGCAVGFVGAALVWWRPEAVVALVGLVVLAAALAGVFPALIALTPARVGEDVAHHVIGWQIGAAGLGGSAISAAMGLAFQRFGLGELGLALVVVAALLVVGSFVLERVAR